MWMGLGAAVCFGTSDFVLGSLARSIGVRRAAFWNQLIGLLAVTMLLCQLPSSKQVFASAPAAAWIAGVAGGLAYLLGSLALTRAYSLGAAAIVGPLGNNSGAVATMLSMINGQIPGAGTLTGAVLCVAGLPLAARGARSTSTSSTPAALYATVASVAFGVSLWVQGRWSVPVLGPWLNLWIAYLVGVPTLIPLLSRLPPKTEAYSRRNIGRLLCVCTLSLCARGCIAVGLSIGPTALVAVLSALSGTVTALLGVLLLRERLTVVQWCGVGVVIAGIVVIHASR
ncbi:EamA family transporter [Paraburkholderia terricola]|uniref:EamA-like transporter family protein n=1 Tax=Paraburkholderia terricola TaxID=169427 RepID=A0A1M6Z0D7_9BURK|nr:EamA-like transporter family protein [Paraburkholderia sediminicola]SHL23825.1 EamA-like transporter family protein [Paraburkholderia terricola]